jgi:glycosyltransferase involved in cell wall biosynthesis
VVGINGSAMDAIILHDQSAWAQQNTPAALADAIEHASGADLRQIGDAAAIAVSERFAWRQVFERLFAIYREVSADYRKATAG